MNLGAAINTLRRVQLIKQGELAEQIKMSQSYLSQIESGNKIPSHKTVEKICKVLKVPVFALYFFATEDEDVQREHLAKFKENRPKISELVISSFKWETNL